MTGDNANTKDLYLLRLGKLGDLVCCEPIIKFLYDRGYRVNLLTSSLGEELYKHHPYVHQIFVLNGNLNLEMVGDFREEIVINLHWADSGEILEVFDFGRRILIHKLNALWWGSLSKSFLAKVQKDLNLDVQFSEINFQPHIHIPISTERKLQSLPFINNQYVVLHRFSNDSSKNTSGGIWWNIINYFISRGYQVVELGGKDVIKHPIEPQLRKNKFYFDCRGMFSILETSYLIKRARLFVGIMSGLSHVANAVRTPALIISNTLVTIIIILIQVFLKEKGIQKFSITSILFLK